MTESCCRTTEDGSVYCAVPSGEAGEKGNCSGTPQDHGQVLISTAEIGVRSAGWRGDVQAGWRQIRSAVMFGMACITSPCCTPLIVPVVIALLAGTPAAAWMTHNAGWVYGGLTLVSIASALLGWRWMRNRHVLEKPKRLSSQAVAQFELYEGESL